MLLCSSGAFQNVPQILFLAIGRYSFRLGQVCFCCCPVARPVLFLFCHDARGAIAGASSDCCVPPPCNGAPGAIARVVISPGLHLVVLALPLAMVPLVPSLGLYLVVVVVALPLAMVPRVPSLGFYPAYFADVTRQFFYDGLLLASVLCTLEPWLQLFVVVC